MGKCNKKAPKRNFGEQVEGRIENIVDVVSGVLAGHGLKVNGEYQVVEGVAIYPQDYFCCFNFETQGFEAVKFVGLQNYKDVITDSLFLKSVLNSAMYCFWSVLIGGFTPLIIATMLNEVVRGKTFFRFATYFPCIIPGIVTSIMWKILFQPDANGFLNMLLGKMGIEPLQWLQNPFRF